ncbi:MAG: hypothetical protein JW793_02925 [Acidobacteria bacterium]|nr:hypothetical protein [Acidobacteriota bacterium]
MNDTDTKTCRVDAEFPGVERKRQRSRASERAQRGRRSRTRRRSIKKMRKAA